MFKMIYYWKWKTFIVFPFNHLSSEVKRGKYSQEIPGSKDELISEVLKNGDSQQPLEDEFLLRPYTYWGSKFITNHPLMLINKYKEPDLLQHDVTQHLINRKWNQFGWIFYYFNLFYYCCFLAALTFYVWTSIPLSPQSYPNLYTCSPYFDENNFEHANQTYIFPEKALKKQSWNYASRVIIDILAGFRLLAVLVGRERETFFLFLPKDWNINNLNDFFFLLRINIQRL